MKIIYRTNKPTYDINKTWEDNYKNGPNFKGPFPPLPQEKNWEFLGFKLISPLGIAAGPLPNSKWLITYANLGFGSLTQKTVRSSAHKSHEFPNVLYVEVKGKLNSDIENPLVASTKSHKPLSKISITNSFGNPSYSPKEWMAQATKAKKGIHNGQLFGVSVYGTSKKNTTIQQLAADYAKTAQMAKKAGAMFIEANLACPNVSGSENPFLYKDERSVAKIAKEIKKKIGNTPLLLKIGYFEKYEDLIAVLKATRGNFEGVSAINTISKKIIKKDGKQALPGRDVSGVCGYAIKDFGIKTVKNLYRARIELKMKFEIVGVGGAMTTRDIVDYLKAGANHVHLATAAMWNPYIAFEFNQKYPSPAKLK